MSRYPYTISCDAIRMATVDPYGPIGCDLSRQQASQIRKLISTAIGMCDEELACKIADYAKANEPATPTP
jgi:hypothetical protein